MKIARFAIAAYFAVGAVFVLAIAVRHLAGKLYRRLRHPARLRRLDREAQTYTAWLEAQFAEERTQR